MLAGDDVLVCVRFVRYGVGGVDVFVGGGFVRYGVRKRCCCLF